MKLVLKVKFVSLVNLIAGREVVQELVAERMTLSRLRHELSRLLNDNAYRQQMLDDYEEMNRVLGGAGASERAAREIVNLLQNRNV